MPISFTWDASAAPSDSLGASAGANALRDKALDPITGDLYLLNGEQGYVTGVDGFISDLGARLQTFLGEWHLDVSIGLPWLTEILGQKVSDQRVAELVTVQILATPGATKVTRLSVSQAGRVKTVVFEVLTDFGVLVSAVLAAIQEE